MQTISQLVRADYRLADVFKNWGVNYCCGGNGTLEDVCRIQGLDQAKIEADIQQAQQSFLRSHALLVAGWPTGFLVDYIIHVHHAYLKTTAPALQQMVETFSKGHATKYPYFADVYEVFKKLVASETEQLHYEEAVIFPYIKQVHHACKEKESYGPLLVRTLHKPLAETAAKTTAQNMLTKLRDATQHYAIPENACTAHQVIYHKLKEFDADLAQHKHLEHALLFPKAVKLEAELLQL